MDKKIIEIELMKMVKDYVIPEYFDVEILINLLKNVYFDSLVKRDIFSRCDKSTYFARMNKNKKTFPDILYDENAYQPIPVEKFIRRIPFYFYLDRRNVFDSNKMGTLGEVLTQTLYGTKENVSSEYIYEELEFMFYELQLPLEDIFSYWCEQTGKFDGDFFLKWCNYLRLCKRNGVTDYFPENFLYSYNVILEKNNLSPIIYEIDKRVSKQGYLREKNKIQFIGRFPCGKDGKPVMKWINLKIHKESEIYCEMEKSKEGMLTVIINPETSIDLIDCSDNNSRTFINVYRGPKNLAMDGNKLRMRRKSLKYTQSDVANAIGVSTKTIQNWESGILIPDGLNLIKLMNWLDINDISEITKSSLDN